MESVPGNYWGKLLNNFKRAVCCQDGQTVSVTVTQTKNGLRLSQHGVVISEVRTRPGPTHSVVDVLAALVAILAPAGRVGVLGFAGGGIMAPLQALGVETAIDSVDLDQAAYSLFRKHCPEWIDRVNWQQGDAVAWLRQQPAKFDLLMDDLSVPGDGDVIKPLITWEVLPGLIASDSGLVALQFSICCPARKASGNPALRKSLDSIRQRAPSTLMTSRTASW